MSKPMTNALLPPDPTRKAAYWLRRPDGENELYEWTPDAGVWWQALNRAYPDELSELGYTLASPHPIPTATQLDALHALADMMVRKKQDYGHILRAVFKGDAP